jgi:hypothetical protein
MWTDPIVEEVRKHRREIEKECNGDFSLLFAKAKEIEKTLKGRLVSKVPGKRTKSKTKILPN